MRPLLHARTLRMTTVQDLTDHLISQLILGDVISLEEREQVGLTVVQTVRDHLISSESPMETAGEKNLLHALLDIVPETMQLQSLLQETRSLVNKAAQGLPKQGRQSQSSTGGVKGDVRGREERKRSGRGPNKDQSPETPVAEHTTDQPPGSNTGHVQGFNPATMSAKDLRQFLVTRGISLGPKLNKDRLIEKCWLTMFTDALSILEEDPQQLQKAMDDLGIPCPKRADRRKNAFLNHFKSAAANKKQIIAHLFQHPSKEDTPEAEATATTQATQQDQSDGSQYVSAPETQSSDTAHGSAQFASAESNVYVTPPSTGTPYFSCSPDREADTQATGFTSGPDDSSLDLGSPRPKRRRTQFPNSSPLPTRSSSPASMDTDLGAHPSEADPASQISDNDILFDSPPFDPSAIFEEESQSDDNAGAEVESEEDDNEHVEAMDVDNDPGSPMSQVDSNSDTFDVWLSAVRRNDRTVDTPQLGLLTFPEIRQLAETLGVQAEKQTNYVRILNTVANALLQRYMKDLPSSFVDHLLETYKLKAHRSPKRRVLQVIGEFKRSLAPVKTEMLNRIVKHWRDAAAAPTTAPRAQQTARGVRERSLPTPCDPVSAPKVKLDGADVKTSEEQCTILRQIRKQKLAQQLGKFKVVPNEAADVDEAQPEEMLPDSWGTLDGMDDIFSILSQPSRDGHDDDDDDHNIGSQASSHQVISFFSHLYSTSTPLCLPGVCRSGNRGDVAGHRCLRAQRLPGPSQLPGVLLHGQPVAGNRQPQHRG